MFSRCIVRIALIVLVASPTLVAADGYVGTTFPSFKAKDAVTGERFALEDLRGHVVLIDFWATWCGPCIHELPQVKQAYAAYRDKGFEIVSISLDREADRSKFRSFIRKERMDWIHVMDGRFWNAELAEQYNVHAIPAMFLLDPSGRCVASGEAIRGEGVLADKIADVMKTTPPTARGGLKARLATEALAAADALYGERQYLKARKAFEEIVESYAATTAAETARAKLKELESNPDIAAAVNAAEADKKAPKILKMARTLANVGKPDKARKYYTRVIDRYPNSKYADIAQQEMNQLGRG